MVYNILSIVDQENLFMYSKFLPKLKRDHLINT